MTDINHGTGTFEVPGATEFSLGVQRYLSLLRQQAELSRKLAVGWAGAMQAMSGIMLTQTTTMGQLVAEQTEAVADQNVGHHTTAIRPERDRRRPVLGLVPNSAPERQASPAQWSIDQEMLRYNVFDEVVARLLEDDIEEAVV